MVERKSYTVASTYKMSNSTNPRVRTLHIALIQNPDNHRIALVPIPYCHERPQEADLDLWDIHRTLIHLDKINHPPTWRYFADLDGRPIPRDIMERMRNAEGLPLAEWEKRGVIVSEVTWNILRKYLEEEMDHLERVYDLVD